MAKPKHLLRKVSDEQIRDFLHSIEVWDAITEEANRIKPPLDRYRITQNPRLRQRAAVKIEDRSEDAFTFELETATLASLPSGGRKPAPKKCRAKDPANCRIHKTGKYAR